MKARGFIWGLLISASLLSHCSSIKNHPSTPAPKSTGVEEGDSFALTPTPTKDLSKPGGATGKNTGGEWIKEVSNIEKTYVWQEIQIGNDAENKITDWFEPHVLNGILNGGMPTIDQEKNGMFPAAPLYINFQDGVDGPYFQHPPNLLDSPTDPTFSRTIYSQLKFLYYGRYTGFSQEENLAFYDGLKTGLTFIVDTPTGAEKIIIGQKTGYIVYVASDDLAKDPRFVWGINVPPDIGIFGSIITSDEQGNFVAIVASQKSVETLSDEEFLQMILLPIARLLNSVGQENYGGQMGAFLISAQFEKAPHFEFIEHP